MEAPDTAVDDSLETVDFDNVEIFSTGTWEGKGSKPGGDKITGDTLKGWVNTFNEVGSKVKPRLRMTHNKDASASVSNMASLGWINNLKTDGQKLFADLKSVPKKLGKLIDAKAFGRFSPGVWGKMNIDGKDHFNVLEHVALLGADLPANLDIDGFIDTYYTNENSYNSENFITYENEVKMDFEKIAKDLESKIDSQAKEYDMKIIDYSKENEDLKSENAKLKSDMDKINYDKKKSDVETFLNDQVKDGVITPAQVALYSKLALGETTEDDGNVKEFSNKFDIIKGIIENSDNKIPMGEKGEKTEVSEKTYSNGKDDEPKALEDMDLDAEIVTYMKDNDEKDYAVAYRAVADSKLDEMEDKE